MTCKPSAKPQAIWTAAALSIGLLMNCGPVTAHGPHHHDADHQVTSPDGSARVARVEISVPDVGLTRHDGAHVKLADELAGQAPTYLNFIYTTCTTICPLTSQIFADVQSKSAAKGENVRLISVSIDPERDTPALLADYARQFGAGPGWSFYTGTVEASIHTQKAFGTFAQDKMNHPVATFFRSSPNAPWTRIDGFATPDQLDDIRAKY